MTATLYSSVLPRGTNRLIIGLGLSVLVHAAIVFLVRPLAVDFVRSQPLRVKIEDVAPAESANLIGALSDFHVPAGSAEIYPEPVEPQQAINASTSSVAGPDFGLAPDRYYTSREVDVRAEPINDVPLVYPQLAYQYRAKGIVLLNILISERGMVDGVSVIEAKPNGIFEEAALNATRPLRFTPAIRGGRPVKSQKMIEVEFDPYQSIHIP
jgi:TonB family protein